MIAKIAEFGKKYRSELLLGVSFVAVVLISFNIGRMSVLEGPKSALQIIPPGAQVANVAGAVTSASGSPKPQQPQDLRVVASKASSSHLYHFMWCSGAKRISEKNKIYFDTEAAAIAAGYSLAGNCQK